MSILFSVSIYQKKSLSLEKDDDIWTYTLSFHSLCRIEKSYEYHLPAD
jgi:hypothetical protein